MSGVGEGLEPRYEPSTVGVAVIARDMRPTVEAAVRSICEQTVRPAQVVFVDDGSTDGTAELVESLAREIPELTVVRSAPAGMSAARNRAVAELRTEYVAIQDADDIALPWRLEEALATFAANPDVAVVGGQMLAFRRAGYAWELPAWPTEPAAIDTMLRRGVTPIAHPTLVVRRDVFDEVGGYDEDVPYGDDLAFERSIAARGHRFAASPRVVTLYRKPRRYPFSRILRRQSARRALRDGRPTWSNRTAALAETVRSWTRERVKPLPPEQPLAAFGIDAASVVEP